MSLSEQLREYIEACFTAIWIEFHEHADALAEISQLCQQQNPPWRLATWDIESGLAVVASALATVISRHELTWPDSLERPGSPRSMRWRTGIAAILPAFPHVNDLQYHSKNE